MSLSTTHKVERYYKCYEAELSIAKTVYGKIKLQRARHVA